MDQTIGPVAQLLLYVAAKAGVPTRGMPNAYTASAMIPRSSATRLAQSAAKAAPRLCPVMNRCGVGWLCLSAAGDVVPHHIKGFVEILDGCLAAFGRKLKSDTQFASSSGSVP